MGFLYLVRGNEIIRKAYKEARGRPFVVHTPSNQLVLISSQQHIRELNKAPSSQMSLHAVAKELIQPIHTMHGFEWENQRGVEGLGFVRALRSILTSRLPSMLPGLRSSIAGSMKSQVKRIKPDNGWHHVPAFRLAKKMVAQVNSFTLFGTVLSQQQDFVDAALQFSEDVFFSAEILRILPAWIGPSVASLITRRHRASRILYERLYPVVEERMRLCAQERLGVPVEMDKPVWHVRLLALVEQW